MSPILGIWASSKFTQADTGAMFPLQVITVGAAGASDVTFTNIPNTYKHLQIRLIGRSNRAANLDAVRVQLNGDTAANYVEHGLYGDGASAAAYASTGQSYMNIYRITGANATSGNMGALYFDILDYADTNKFKTMRMLGGADNNGSGEIYFVSGLWRSTSATTSMKLYPAVGTLFSQYTTVALYAVKGA